MDGARRFGLGALAMLFLVAAGPRAVDAQGAIQEILGGCGATPGAQYVELSGFLGLERFAGCLQLEFRDVDGQLVGEFEFPVDPPPGAFVVLVATADFAQLPRAPRPDFVMPPFVTTPAGEVCLRSTGQPGCGPLSTCVAYGDNVNRPARALPLFPDGAASLQRLGPEFGNRGYGLLPPTPQNAAGTFEVFDCTHGVLVEEGARLFFEETFDGNGRTCGTCHPADHSFTVGPRVVAALPAADPLFVAENDPALAGLERTPLLRGPRALILENIDGFDLPPVFRGTPHLLNVGDTAPYGLSGEVADLQTFSAMAVRQHFTRSLARVPGVDFREPTGDELAALEAFMRTIVAGNPQGVDLFSLVLGPAAARGLDLFFRKNCGGCHFGPFLSGLPAFDTGVTRRDVNLVAPPECPTCPPIGPLEGGRAFDVPALVGIRDTAPFFHDNSAATLRDAVAHYGSEAFNRSPAGAIFGPIKLSSADIDDLTAFIESLTACGNGVLDPDEQCDDGNAQDGDCCSATCTTTAADGVACDDGNACTTATECRGGSCLAFDPDPCELAPLGPLDASTITCAVSSFLDTAPQCQAHAGKVRRRLVRGVRRVESAAAAASSNQARKTLARAAVAFGRAAALARRDPFCRLDVAPAAEEAQRRAICESDRITGGSAEEPD
jgi:cysteine-rich repeat protein